LLTKNYDKRSYLNKSIAFQSEDALKIKVSIVMPGSRVIMVKTIKIKGSIICPALGSS